MIAPSCAISSDVGVHSPGGRHIGGLVLPPIPIAFLVIFPANEYSLRQLGHLHNLLQSIHIHRYLGNTI